MRGSGLGTDTETAVRVAAAMAAHAEVLERELEVAARRCDRGEVEVEAVEEVLLQGHLFLGFPATLEGLARWRRLGVAGPVDAGPEEPRGAADRRERGRRLCRRVYGDAYERLRANVRGLHPALDRWMVEEGYGKVLARPGLGVEERELCVVATLAVAGRLRQLDAHLHGALNVGSTADRVEAALATAEAVAGGALEGPRERWARVRKRAEEEG